jgi:glycosyltransferase involved in cell wall biosynthesis
MALNIICYFQEVEPNPSAVAIRAKFFIQALESKLNKFDIRIKVLTATEIDLQDSELVKYISFSGGRSDEMTSVANRILAEFKFGLKAFFWVIRNKKNAALVISTPNYIPSLFLSLAAFMSRVPYVLDVRDAYPEAYAQSGLIKCNTWIYKIFSRASNFMYRHAASITTATEGLKGCISGFKDNVTCIYNGFPSAFTGMSEPKHSKFSVCFHGVMGFFQDIEKLAELIQHPELSDVDFIIIGYGRKSALIESISKNNCRYLGRLSYADTIKQISKCHLGISLRVVSQISFDSFPVKVWEYLGLGIPSLVYPESEASKFLQSNNCGIQLSSVEIDELTKIILQLKLDGRRYQGMVKSCREVRPTYSRESLSGKFAEVVRNSFKIGL